MMNQVQKTVEVPRVQFIDRLVDDPAVMRKEAASNMALSEEEGQEQTEARSLGQGRERGCEEDDAREAIWSKWRQTWGPVAHTPRPRWTKNGTKNSARSVRRERKLDVKTDVAASRLERLERESSQLEDEEREASLGEALTDRTKVVKLTVDKWFVDKGYGFGRVPLVR